MHVLPISAEGNFHCKIEEFLGSDQAALDNLSQPVMIDFQFLDPPRRLQSGYSGSNTSWLCNRSGHMNCSKIRVFPCVPSLQCIDSRVTGSFI